VVAVVGAAVVGAAAAMVVAVVVVEVEVEKEKEDGDRRSLVRRVLSAACMVSWETGLTPSEKARKCRRRCDSSAGRGAQLVECDGRTFMLPT
jgi:hypothetical protein